MKTMNGFLFSKVIGYPEAFSITPFFLIKPNVWFFSQAEYYLLLFFFKMLISITLELWDSWSKMKCEISKMGNDKDLLAWHKSTVYHT